MNAQIQRNGHQEKAPHVVIVGGGFAGLNAARTLARRPVRITLLDRQNHHLFSPLLYQVATAALSPGEIAEPIRAIMRKHHSVHVLLGEITAVDPTTRRVLLADGEEVKYDYLILATGARHSYFGHDEWEPMAPGLKTLDDALEIRRRILLAFELAEREHDPAVREALLTFVIVGGGPTGVELAGAITEIARHTIARDFRSIDPAQARVILVEAGPRVLAMYPPNLSESAERTLRSLGVEVRTNSMVTAITEDAVHAGDAVIPTRTALWAAGAIASPVAKSLGAPLDRTGRVQVEPDLSVPGHPEIFVAGDLASFAHQTGKPLPGVAQVAIQQGRAAAENVWRTIQGEPRRPFHYHDLGNMAIIGRGAAIADFGRVRLTGPLAWLMWVFIHIYNLIGFDNRMLVLLQWAWSYLTWHRGARLITRVTARAGIEKQPALVE